MVEIADPILHRLREALLDAYGGQVERVVLFGSRVRGDARPDSDYDVAVFFRGVMDRRTEHDRLADLWVDLIDETGAFLDARPFPSAAYHECTPLMQEIRRDGLEL